MAIPKTQPEVSMKDRLRKSTSTLIALALLSCSVTGDVHAILAKDIASAKPKKLVNYAGLKPFKKATKVAVVGYRVGFVVKNKATARAENILGGGFGAGGAKAKMEVTLGNPDFALMQEITEESYKTFLETLKETGLEVIPAETAEAAVAGIKDLDITATTLEKPFATKVMKTAQVVAFSPKGLPLWFSACDTVGIGDKNMMQAGNQKRMAKLAKELGAVVVYPTLLVDFADLKSSGNSKFASRASVEATSSVSVSPLATHFFTDDGMGLPQPAALGEAIEAEGDPGELMTIAQANNEGFVKNMNDIGINLGPASAKKDLVLKADPVRYKTQALESLTGAAQLYKLAIQDIRK